jgi:hypothetical protein
MRAQKRTGMISTAPRRGFLLLVVGVDDMAVIPMYDDVAVNRCLNREVVFVGNNKNKSPYVQ